MNSESIDESFSDSSYYFSDEESSTADSELSLPDADSVSGENDSSQEVNVSDEFYTEILEHCENINLKLDNITHLSVLASLGVGIVIGVLLSQILARYFIG